MSMITINVLSDIITGSYNGKSFGVSFEKELYDEMLKLQEQANSASTVDEAKAIVDKFELLTIEDFKVIIEGASKFLFVNPKTNETFLKYNGIVSNVPMPKNFVDRLNTSIEKDIDIKPMVKFWIRVLRNPNLTALKLERITNYINITYVDNKLAEELMGSHGISLEVALERATLLQVSITNEGLLETYKVSREIRTKFDTETGEKVDRYKSTFDEITGLKTYEEKEHVEDLIFEPVMQGDRMDAFFSGDDLGHIIRVGKVHKLESWDQVDCDDNRSCVKGLHVGNMDYIRGYQNSGTVTHRVFVDPMFIGAVPDDSSGAIRCKEYMVHSTLDKLTKNMYNSSTYASQTDAQWNTMAAEAVKENQEFFDTRIKDMKTVKEQLAGLSI